MELKINEVFTFKLNSGEEVIGKVTAVNTNTVYLTEPLSVAPGPQGMGLVASIFTSQQDSTVVLNMNAVTMYTETEENIKNTYIKTTTGISLPSKKIILG